MRRRPVALAIIAALLGSCPLALAQSDAKSYSTSYVSFRIPGSWDCALEETTHICHEKGRENGLEMLAVIAAKFADPARDNPSVYISELGHPRERKDSSGRTVVARLIGSGTRCIDGHVWYWGKQLGSELPNYFTEYFASIQSGIAMVVTVSYAKSIEAEGRPIARTIASNLRPLPVADAPSGAPPDTPCSGGD
jgi:hypothetical protein